MSEIIAYDEITLLDIADTATYIYYSENIDGTGASLAPSSTTKYIGIYSGPSFPDGQPQVPPSETVWSRYVGEKGEKGDKGEDANAYYIETNQEEILRFVNSDNTYSYSPERLTFKIFNNPKQPSDDDNDAQISLTEDNYQLEVIGEADPISKDEDYLRLGFQINAENTEEIGDPKTVYFNIKEYLKTKGETKSSLIFRFSYILNNEVAAIKIVEMRNGVTDDMAKFSVHANGITAAIQYTKLKFSSEGLTILNGGINIVNKENDSVFSGDTNGNLTLKGTIYADDGEFRGKIYANDGEFIGKITAETGSIGGLTIDGNIIYSGQDSTNSPLQINGDGSIYAQNITLGDQASIENQISLGKAYIKNPNNHRGIFLQAGKISLSEDGKFNLGNIEAYGGSDENGIDSYIKSSDNFAAWEINGDGTAKFKEIIVDKATIQNSIMEIGKIQAVGSMVFFKDSWKVIEKGEKTCKIEVTLFDENRNSIMPLKVGDFILANGNDYYKIDAIDTSNSTLTLNKPCSFNVGDIITKIGNNEDYLITIQGDSNQDVAYSTKNSLTMSTIEIPENSLLPNFTKKIVLGDLTSIDSNYKTGLYAENVYLKGTLTTEAGETYAGVNTLTGATANKFGEEDKTKIIFWAGSSDKTETSIQQAPFQVTEAGSIYANKGIFEGSLITKSTIKGASIHTAKIFGEVEEEGKYTSAPLQIYNTDKGIQFFEFIYKETEDEIFDNKKEYYEYINEKYMQTEDTSFQQDKRYYERTEKGTLEIQSSGIISEGKTFISLVNEISYFGNSAKISNDNSALFLKPDFIGFANDSELTSPNWKIKFNDGFNFSDDNSIFEIKSDLVKSTQKVNFEQGVVFGVSSDSGTLEYQKTTEGYNLYVR